MKPKNPLKNVAASVRDRLLNVMTEKHVFDLWHLAKGFAFEGQAVSESIRATFERRAKALPATVPVGFTAEFWSDPRRQAMWAAFGKKSVRTKPFPSLESG